MILLFNGAKFLFFLLSLLRLSPASACSDSEDSPAFLSHSNKQRQTWRLLVAS